MGTEVHIFDNWGFEQLWSDFEILGPNMVYLEGTIFTTFYSNNFIGTSFIFGEVKKLNLI